MDEDIFRWSSVMTSSADISIHFPWAASGPVRSDPPKFVGGEGLASALDNVDGVKAGF